MTQPCEATRTVRPGKSALSYLWWGGRILTVRLHARMHGDLLDVQTSGS